MNTRNLASQGLPVGVHVVHGVHSQKSKKTKMHKSAAATNVEDAYAMIERAGIMAEDGRAPPEWLDEMIRVEFIAAPEAVDLDDWRAIRDAALTFADTHGAKAAAAGWAFNDLFGQCAETAFAESDRNSIAWLLAAGATPRGLRRGSIFVVVDGRPMECRRAGGPPATAL